MPKKILFSLWAILNGSKNLALADQRNVPEMASLADPIDSDCLTFYPSPSPSPCEPDTYFKLAGSIYCLEKYDWFVPSFPLKTIRQTDSPICGVEWIPTPPAPMVVGLIRELVLRESDSNGWSCYARVFALNKTSCGYTAGLECMDEKLEGEVYSVKYLVELVFLVPL